MSRKILVDTSIWVNYFKDDPSTTVFIEKNLFTKEIYITGPIITELLAGTESTKEKKILAGELLSSIKAKGKSINKTDALIASVAYNNDCEILSLNKSLQLIDIVKKANIT